MMTLNLFWSTKIVVVQLCVIYAPVLVSVLITIVAIGTSSLHLLRGALNRDACCSIKQEGT